MCVIKISWENLQLPRDYSFMIWLVLLGIWPRESMFSRQVERRLGFRSSVMPSSFYSCAQAEYSFSLTFVREFSVFPPLFCLSPSQFFFSGLLLPNGFCLSTYPQSPVFSHSRSLFQLFWMTPFPECTLLFQTSASLHMLFLLPRMAFLFPVSLVENAYLPLKNRSSIWFVKLFFSRVHHPCICTHLCYSFCYAPLWLFIYRYIFPH